MQGDRIPVIHTVGFFAEEQRGGPGERFLRQLSALTGGTFQARSSSCSENLKEGTRQSMLLGIASVPKDSPETPRVMQFAGH